MEIQRGAGVAAGFLLKPGKQAVANEDVHEGSLQPARPCDRCSWECSTHQEVARGLKLYSETFNGETRTLLPGHPD